MEGIIEKQTMQTTLSHPARKIVAVDLFAGAGGLSLGAAANGINVMLSVEKNRHAAKTYAFNHPHTTTLCCDVSTINENHLPNTSNVKLLMGGPPCQGYSTSNQRTRTTTNPNVWLFREFLRIAEIWKPEWIVFENVRGLVEFNSGTVFRDILDYLYELGYQTRHAILNSSDFGVPQLRNRLFIVAYRPNYRFSFPHPSQSHVTTVQNAIGDLPYLKNGASTCEMPYSGPPRSQYAKSLRNGLATCKNNLVTRNADYIIERFKHIPQGGNWQDIPQALLSNYRDPSRCHTGIYRRLEPNRPAPVLVNFRKNMVIHPKFNRGLSVREAARIQSFPDSFVFCGSIGFQQQQVSDAVPPILAEVILKQISSFCQNGSNR